MDAAGTAGEQQDLTATALDALAEHIAVLDERGVILQVNRAWVEFGARNGMASHAGFVGANYLEVCEAATGAGADDAHAIAAGLRELVEGRRDRFEIEYPCHSPVAERWFLARATRSSGPSASVLVVAHEDITERRRAQEQLARTNTLLETTQELARTGGWEYEVDTGRLSWSTECFRMHEVPRGTYAPTMASFLEFCAPEDRARLGTLIRRALDEGADYETEVDLLTARGRRLRVHTVGRPLVQGGRVTRLYGACRDVTSDAAAARMLRASEDTLRRAQEVARLGSFLFDEDAQSWAISPVTEEIFGMRPGDTPTFEAWAAAIHADDRASVVAAVRHATARRQPYAGEYRIVRPRDGDVRWVFVLSEPTDERHRAGVVQDITERKLSELALRASELRYRALVDSEMDAIVAVDERFRVQVFNAAAERLFGVAAQDAIGSPIERFIPPAQRAGHAGHMHAFGEQRATARRMGRLGQVTALRADGVEVPVEASISHVRTESGVLYTAVLRDITERLRVEEEVRELNRDLERRVAERTDALMAANRRLSELVEELEAFSYSVSHDLRAPLRAIAGFAHMVVEDEGARLTAEGRRRLDVVERNAQRMGELIDDLLALARINRTELQRRPLDLARLSADVVAELAPTYPGTRVEIGALPLIEGDLTLIRQVLVNLVGNAFKYSAYVAEPRVAVRWDAAEGALVVEDNGIGFDLGHARNLFGMFQRLHSDARYEGTGVGLAIVKRIVERHDGRVWARSSPGAGASFFVALPTPDATQAAAA